MYISFNVKNLCKKILKNPIQLPTIKREHSFDAENPFTWRKIFIVQTCQTSMMEIEKKKINELKKSIKYLTTSEVSPNIPIHFLD